MEKRVLTEIPKIILYSSKHPLYNKSELTLRDFQYETFFTISNEEVSYAGNLVKACCQEYGFIPKIHYVSNIESMNICVQNGMGVAISDLWSGAKDRCDFGYLELEKKQKITLAWPANFDKEKVIILANEMKLMLEGK